jgi:hypothetical protein
MGRKAPSCIAAARRDYGRPLFELRLAGWQPRLKDHEPTGSDRGEKMSQPTASRLALSGHRAPVEYDRYSVARCAPYLGWKQEQSPQRQQGQQGQGAQPDRTCLSALVAGPRGGSVV